MGRRIFGGNMVPKYTSSTRLESVRGLPQQAINSLATHRVYSLGQLSLHLQNHRLDTIVGVGEKSIGILREALTSASLVLLKPK